MSKSDDQADHDGELRARLVTLVDLWREESRQWSVICREKCLTDDKKWHEAFGARRAYDDAADDLCVVLYSETAPAAETAAGGGGEGTATE